MAAGRVVYLMGYGEIGGAGAAIFPVAAPSSSVRSTRVADPVGGRARYRTALEQHRGRNGVGLSAGPDGARGLYRGSRRRPGPTSGCGGQQPSSARLVSMDSKVAASRVNLMWAHARSDAAQGLFPSQRARIGWTRRRSAHAGPCESPQRRSTEKPRSVAPDGAAMRHHQGLLVALLPRASRTTSRTIRLGPRLPRPRPYS